MIFMPFDSQHLGTSENIWVIRSEVGTRRYNRGKLVKKGNMRNFAIVGAGQRK